MRSLPPFKALLPDKRQCRAMPQEQQSQTGHTVTQSIGAAGAGYATGGAVYRVLARCFNLRLNQFPN